MNVGIYAPTRLAVVSVGTGSNHNKRFKYISQPPHFTSCCWKTKNHGFKACWIVLALAAWKQITGTVKPISLFIKRLDLLPFMPRDALVSLALQWNMSRKLRLVNLCTSSTPTFILKINVIRSIIIVLSLKHENNYENVHVAKALLETRW